MQIHLSEHFLRVNTREITICGKELGIVSQLLIRKRRGGDIWRLLVDARELLLLECHVVFHRDRQDLLERQLMIIALGRKSRTKVLYDDILYLKHRSILRAFLPQSIFMHKPSPGCLNAVARVWNQLGIHYPEI